jgi:predicted nucleic acid-binding Zn ribbon protein
MDQIKDIIPKVIENLSQKKPEKQLKIQELWRNILNDKQAKHTTINNFKDGRLMVLVDSSVWLYQMNTQKGRLLKELKEHIPEIENILFRIGTMK